ncbi:MAG TPA: hypothetical protein DCQ10_14415 [Rhodobacteraceae bacterium]|nr:hypothetical protein [Paracoccaceae bacterium]
MANSSKDDKLLKNNENIKNTELEIVFFGLAHDKIVGGVKVTYKHAEMIASLGVQSSVYSPDNLGFNCSWFDHNATIRTEHELNKKSNFIVLPEIWAGRYGKQLLRAGFRYAIYVQNGYYLNSALNWGHSAAEVKEVYENANLILSISKDTTSMISTVYPSVDKKKVIRVFPHVDDGFFPGKKEKIISYMPRKLPVHSKRLKFYLTEYLPADWSVVPIENMVASKAADILSRSSIFLSFCDLEGFGLPPLEAALSGAVVVGYTGQGAREYFKKPNLIAVQNGDLKNFTLKTADAIKAVDAGLLDTEEFQKGRALLAEKYGRENERRQLEAFVKRVEMTF